MNLELIRTLGLKRPGGIKGLAKEVDMSHINLFRCIREGSIKAQDLERIAIALKVNILDFFPGFPDIPERNMDISIGNNSVSSFMVTTYRWPLQRALKERSRICGHV